MSSTRRSILGLMGAAPLAASGHLLTHTSGLGDHMQLPGFWETAATWTSPEQVMDGTTAIHPAGAARLPPGAGKQYSNSGYHLLGAIVAQASGQPRYNSSFGPADRNGSPQITGPGYAYRAAAADMAWATARLLQIPSRNPKPSCSDHLARYWAGRRGQKLQPTCGCPSPHGIH
jgi:hypothetical protein